MRWVCARAAAALLLGALLPASADAQPRKPAAVAAKPKGSKPRAPSARRAPLDRVVVRWSSRATGGVAKPQVITARELAFEARIEAMSDEESKPADKHVRAAIQRHIAESMLAMLPVKPKPTPKHVGQYAEAARVLIEQQVGGRAKLNAAATAEGITAAELNAMLRRRARASWYLDKMIAPMLSPTELDLREVHRRGETPFTNQRFVDIEQPLRRWYVSTRLSDALEQYYRNARARVRVVVIE